MAQNSRWRFNPFTETYNPLTIASEQHTIEYHPEFNAYGIFCDEAIQFDNPSSVTIAGYTEVSRLTTPTGTQFRVDYATETFYNTGFIEFHSSKNGLTVTVAYKGRGTLIHPTFRTLTNYNYAGDVNIEGTTQSTSTITGALKTAGGLGVVKNAYIGGLLRVTDSTASTSSTTGALVVTGGVGIGGNLNIDGNIVVSKSNPLILLNDTGVPSSALLRWQDNGVSRWELYMNASRSLILQLKDSGGTLVNTPLNFSSTTGDLSLGTNLFIDGNLIRTDITNNRVGINKTTPASTLDVVGTISATGDINTTSATASTSTTTGALVVTGGIGIGGALYVGGIGRVTNATESAGPTSGALVVTGGVGIGKKLQVNGDTLIFGRLDLVNGELQMEGGFAIGTSTPHSTQAAVTIRRRILRGVFNVGVLTQNTNHNLIGNPVTNNKIISLKVMIKHATNQEYYVENKATTSHSLVYALINNTFVTVERYASTTANSFVIVIDYID